MNISVDDVHIQTDVYVDTPLTDERYELIYDKPIIEHDVFVQTNVWVLHGCI